MQPFKTRVGIHFSHASGKDAHASVFYLHLEPDNCFAAAGVWHPDIRSFDQGGHGDRAGSRPVGQGFARS